MARQNPIYRQPGTQPYEPFDAVKARKVMLDVISEFQKMEQEPLQTKVILHDVLKRLKCPKELQIEQAVLTLWHDLFRNGQLSHGFNFDNPGENYCHLTDAGRETLKHASRDPANPSGYLEYLEKQGSVVPVARSYVEEALHTYNSDCFKAAAVMTGAATERLVLDLRDTLVAGITTAGRHPAPNLADWRYKTVRDAITVELDSQKANMYRKDAEAYSSFWIPLTEQPRVARNDAGHPVSIDPVTRETVHASLLLLPELIGLCARMTAWIKKHYV